MHFLRTRPALFGLAGLVAVARRARDASPSSTPPPSRRPRPDAVAHARRRRRRRRPRRPRRRRPPTPSPTPAAEARCPMDGETAGRPRALPSACRSSSRSRTTRSPGRRPGLNRADLVIEAPVEGDTTRFMAVFMCDDGGRRCRRAGALGALLQHRPLPAAAWPHPALRWRRAGARAAATRNGVPRVERADQRLGLLLSRWAWGAPHNVFLDVDAARAEIEDGGLPGAPRSRTGGPRPVRVRPGRRMPGGPKRRQPSASTTIELLALWLALDGDERRRWLRTDGGAPNFGRHHRDADQRQHGPRPGRATGRPSR